ncbi:beta-lactamase family protein [Muricauda sp. SCSIO 64092]|uniref:serine hydrolase domain-containing protein n=1 Tax=Allomuricauda sp. SCSIO 64092 TaxID=2908842 RepID=UPI001FF21466|nr:serine hydrolase domain-containing protein [Muricauda sp. SCSIO 64092]UOY08068.1 beta-lactamase family protein [Muricauda sp. SCSIO 64092]
MKFFLATGVFMLLVYSSFPQSKTLEAFIDEYAGKNNYNGTILVEKNGKTVYNKSFGMANFQFNVPNNNDTKYKIASVTKLFTSVLIMQLYDQGKLKLDEKIKTYLPDYTGDVENKVTIYHLLTATSGLESFEKNGDEVYENRFDSDEILVKYCSGPLENAPGEKFNYNNADFFILAKILERIYDLSYGEILKNKIVEPLGMTNSGLAAHSKVIIGLAYAYDWDKDSKTATNEPFYYIENYGGAGAMYSTSGDLLKFSKALYSNQIIREETLELLLKPYLSAYACGLWVYEKEIGDKKLRVAERQGSIEGSNTRFIRILNENSTIVLLSNMYTANLNELQFEIMKRLVE